MASRDLDYDEEAKKLFERLNLMNASTKPAIYNPMDPIWRDPKTGGTIFVGNQTAAANKSLLDSNGITHVVNCTDNMPQYHQNANNKAPIAYMRFPISFWMRHEKQLPEFIRPLITFVDGALAKGESVLVHCLAGAHRAGTTGCLLLMYKAGMPRMEAIRSAKKLRPVIDPIGGLPELLKRYEELRNAGKL